ncbi:MAG: hypothetical protein HOW97_10075 [Catenulispora sp.]|nr:hypothetical protein [Catenulispora sp.]
MSAPTHSRAAAATGAGTAATAVVLGEVRTCLLQNRDPLATPATVALMRLTPGAPVSHVERPVRRVVSADQICGIDCGLRLARRGRSRAVGTVLSHAITTSGRVLQGSAQVTLTAVGAAERQAWRHYLRRPGTAEIMGWPHPADVADGFLDAAVPARGLDLDLASISDRVIEAVQADPMLDHSTPLRARTSVVRWAAILDPGHDDAAVMHLTKSVAPGLHFLRFQGRPADLAMLDRFCEEFARHEWLLNTMQEAVLDRAERDLARDLLREHLDKLGFALNQLVPLWMPPTHLSPQMKTFWTALEDQTRYSRIFERHTTRVRDLRDQFGLRSRRN